MELKLYHLTRNGHGCDLYVLANSKLEALSFFVEYIKTNSLFDEYTNDKFAYCLNSSNPNTGEYPKLPDDYMIYEYQKGKVLYSEVC